MQLVLPVRILDKFLFRGEVRQEHFFNQVLLLDLKLERDGLRVLV